MLTNKERSYLRGLGHKMQPLFQIGKNGIEDTFIDQVDKALEARELIKIKVLNNSDFEAREASDIICKEVNCEGVLAIGNKFLIYRQSKEKQKIELP